MKLKPFFKLLTVACFTASCTALPTFSTGFNNMKVLQELAEDFAQCKTEIKPPLSPETQQLYNYARYHDLHKLWTGTAGAWTELAPYYRIAAYNGDYKANLRLQWLLQTGRVVVKKPQTEVYYLNKELEKTLPATAMYKLYYHLDSNYGVKTQKPEGKFAYLRRAADMGSRDAQLVVGQTLAQIKDDTTLSLRLNLRKQLLECAANQGQGEAAMWQGVRYQAEKKYTEAIKLYHQGVKAGNQQSAYRLSEGFKMTNPKIRGYLGGRVDLERAKRYEMIDSYLFKYDFLQPTVPDLDEIVPLPPAKLPAWDGKIAFQRWFEGPSPAKPSDELMKQLAEKAELDWQTGLPLKK